MLLRQAIITNYKSFLSPAKVEFGPGFNVIVGRNNSGKSALLEAISLGFEAVPHRSPVTIPKVRDQYDT